MSINEAKKKTSDWLLSQNSFNHQELSVDRMFCRKAKTVSVTSGKGGVGKTSVSVKMSRMLAERGHKTLLIDCDCNLSNTTVKLGYPVSNNFYELITGEKNFDDCVIREGNFHLLSGCNGNVDLFENGIELSRVIVDLIVEQERNYDYIILDCPAGISRDVLNINAYTDYRFVIITPDKSSITDSYSLMKILHTKYGVTSNHLLINKVSNLGQYQRMVKILSETVENYMNCRLSILGGLAKQDDAVDMFDRILMEEENSSLHQDFSKALDRFTEEFMTHAGSSSRILKRPFCRDDFGQNVQHMS